MTKNLRLCRPTNATDGHYWDKNTGKPVPDPRKSCYTPEETCPCHRK